MFYSGDLFGMFDDVLYCRLHFEMMTAYPGPVEHMDMCPPLQSPGGEYDLGNKPHSSCILQMNDLLMLFSEAFS